MYFVFVEHKNLKAQDTFSENQFYFYPFMVIFAVRMYLDNVQLSKSNQIKNPEATGLELFTAYIGNFEKEHTSTKRTLASSNASLYAEYF